MATDLDVWMSVDIGLKISVAIIGIGMAGSILVPVGDSHAEVRDRMVAAAESITIGDGLEAGVTMGPVISARHKERVLGYVEQGVKEGARLVADGRARRLPSDGFFVGPSVFDQVSLEMTIGREEIFLPGRQQCRHLVQPSVL